MSPHRSAGTGAGTPGPGRPVPRGRPVHRVGDRALLVDCADGAEARGLHAALLADPQPGQGELLPGARTLLVLLTEPATARALARTLATLAPAPVTVDPGREVVLDTVYDGADLADVARALDRSVDALVREHTDRRWTAAFVGFAPGFAYLEPDGAAWDVPRRAVPRTVVPSGSVAVAGPWSAVYPRASPGGWQLLGRTDATLWDLNRERPASITAGTRVRFRAVRDRAVAAGPGVAAGPAGGAGRRSGGHVPPPAHVPPPSPVPSPERVRPGPVPDARPGLEVLAPGPLALVEDLGRPGHLGLGVGASGALDRAAAVRANRLVGNPRGAAVVETVLGGLTLRAHGTQVLAVTGAPVGLARRRADGAPAGDPPHAAPFRLGPGETLVLGPPPTGLRAYVAVRGGLAADVVLGSRSTDVLSGLGPAPLRAGDVLAVLPPPPDAVAAWPDPPAPVATGLLTVRVVPGPRDDWLAGGVAGLCAAAWTVGPELDRVGLRVTGAEPLVRSRAGELASEGVVAGAVQVPPSGEPVVFLADHPVTGGYPVVAVVRSAELDALAQLRPGDRVRFVPDDAPDRLRAGADRDH